MRTLCRFFKIIIEDFKRDNPLEILFIWFANAVPNLFIFRVIKTAFLRAAGVEVLWNGMYFKSPIIINSPRNLKISHGVFLNSNVMFEGAGKVVIGSNCQIGPNVIFATTNHDIADNMGTSVADIRVEDNVWIGAGSIILGGIQIGPNVVVAAGAVVNRSFSNSMLAGIPARCIQQLN